MTATPTHTPRRMARFSCSHICTFSMHPCGKMACQPSQGSLTYQQTPHMHVDDGVSKEGGDCGGKEARVPAWARLMSGAPTLSG